MIFTVCGVQITWALLCCCQWVHSLLCLCSLEVESPQSPRKLTIGNMWLRPLGTGNCGMGLYQRLLGVLELLSWGRGRERETESASMRVFVLTSPLFRGNLGMQIVLHLLGLIMGL